MKAFILTAGLGTRMRPLTEKRAKPSFPVLGVPLLWHWSRLLHEQLGITEIAVNIHHAPETLLPVLEDKDFKAKIPVNFHISDERDGLLGSSGCLWRLRPWIGQERLVLVNGDTLARVDLRKLEKTHQKMKGQMTLALLSMDARNETQYTTVEMDSFQRVLGFGPKANHGLMYCGVSILEASALDPLPPGASEMISTIFKPLSSARLLFGTSFESPFLDIGSPAAYFRAHFGVLDQFPEFESSVRLKMKSINDVFVPTHWPYDSQAWVSAKVRGPAVFYGDFSEWKNFSDQNDVVWGPNFLGLTPPTKAERRGSFENGISFGNEFIEVKVK